MTGEGFSQSSSFSLLPLAALGCPWKEALGFSGTSTLWPRARDVCGPALAWCGPEPVPVLQAGGRIESEENTLPQQGKHLKIGRWLADSFGGQNPAWNLSRQSKRKHRVAWLEVTEAPWAGSPLNLRGAREVIPPNLGAPRGILETAGQRDEAIAQGHSLSWCHSRELIGEPRSMEDAQPPCVL